MPPEYPTEHAQRGGHIPSATNIPWSQAVNDNDGTFKSVGELKTLYESKGITPDKEIITYCRIGERSSHTWFVLKYLLGYPDVKNYDGSWTEWGNLIANPIKNKVLMNISPSIEIFLSITNIFLSFDIFILEPLYSQVLATQSQIN